MLIGSNSYPVKAAIFQAKLTYTSHCLNQKYLLLLLPSSTYPNSEASHSGKNQSLLRAVGAPLSIERARWLRARYGGAAAYGLIGALGGAIHIAGGHSIGIKLPRSAHGRSGIGGHCPGGLGGWQVGTRASHRGSTHRARSRRLGVGRKTTG